MRTNPVFAFFGRVVVLLIHGVGPIQRDENNRPEILTGREPEVLTFGGRSYSPERVVELLDPFVSDERKTRIEEVLASRTRSVVPVVEGVHDLGNVGAIIRSAEGLGCQELHVIDRGDRFKKSRRTSQGAEKWIDLHKWSDPIACVESLRSRGYTIVVTHFEGAIALDAIDFAEPTAIVFGNEADGVSPEMLEAADQRCVIPMFGFAQSFNVSVAVAVSLYHALRARRRNGRLGDLQPNDLVVLKAKYYARSVQAAGQILKRLASKRG